MAYQCLLLAAMVSVPDSNVRPQAIAFPIGVAFLWAIYELRRRPRAGWYAVFPLGMLVWVNSHGSFVMGLLMIGIWLLDEVAQSQASAQSALSQARPLPDGVKGVRGRLWRARPAAIALGLALLACLANPRGPGIFGYVGTMLGNSVVQGLVPEWAPPSFATMGGAVFLSLLLLIVGLAAGLGQAADALPTADLPGVRGAGAQDLARDRLVRLRDGADPGRSTAGGRRTAAAGGPAAAA